MIPAEVGSAELARALGKTERIVAARKGEGRLPVTPAGKIDLFAIVQAGFAALAQRAPGSPGDAATLDEARIRLTNAQAEAREMLNAQMRGEAVLSEDLEAVAGALVDSARARILALPTKLAPLLLGKDSPQEVKEILTDAAHECCADLAAGPAAGAVRGRARERAGSRAGAEED